MEEEKKRTRMEEGRRRKHTNRLKEKDGNGQNE